MITTFTANPSIDKTLRFEEDIMLGGVNRAAEVVVQPGGKGINVALGLTRAGVAVRAVFPANPSDPLLPLLPELDVVTAPAPAAVRTNVSVVTPSGTTKINEPGAEFSRAEIEELERTLFEASGDYVMLSGSLAPGFPTDEYVQLVHTLHERGAWVGVDTSDEPLAAIAANLPDAAPDFLKPNADELAELIGANGDELEAAASKGDYAQLIAASRQLHEAGVANVLVSLGSAGAMLTNAEGTWFAPAPKVTPRSTVGAGDSSVAGFLQAFTRGASSAKCLAWAVAYGSAAVTLPGTSIPRLDAVTPDFSAVTRLA